MTNDHDDKDEWSRDPASAVELLELHLTFEHWNPDPETVTLPRDVARVVLECAQKGLHKGRGRRGVSLSHGDKMRRESVALWAKRRKAKLQADNPNMNAGDAEVQAADEAVKLLHDRYGMNLAAATIKRRMESIKGG